MPNVTTVITIDGCIACDNNVKAQPGDAVKIYLDAAKFDDVSTPINGTIVGIAENAKNSAYTDYTIQFNNDQLPEGILNIEQCDVASILCQTCCDSLQSQLDTLNGQVGGLYTFSLDGNELVAVNNKTGSEDARLDISGIPFLQALDDLHVAAGSYSPVSDVVTIPIVDKDDVTVGNLVIDLSSIGATGAVTAYAFNPATNEYDITSSGNTLSVPVTDVNTDTPGQVTITDPNGDSVVLPTSPLTANESWMFSVAKSISSAVGAAAYDLTALSEWTGDVTNANFARVRGKAVFSTARANGGSAGTRYGIQVKAGGVTVADASFVKGSDAGDADDSAIIVDGGEFLVPIAGANINWEITLTVNGSEGDMANQVSTLELIGFEKKNSI